MTDDLIAFELPKDAPEWVQLARVGTWKGHPVMGTETVTPEKLAAAHEYFDRHFAANGADLPIDYHHASVLALRLGVKAPAAGWISATELRADGTELWGRVAWTVVAGNEISARQYRYISPVLQFGAPDRVTGEPVAMRLHSVALTNTPFMTELQALNHDAVADAGRGILFPEGGAHMNVLKGLAAALAMGVEQFAELLGLATDADDKTVGEAVKGLVDSRNAQREELAALKGATPPPASEAVLNALEVAPGDDGSEVEERAILARVLQLKAGADLGPVCGALGIDAGSDVAMICNAIDGLKADVQDKRVADLVDGAISEGRIAPAQRELFLNAARGDFDVAETAINSMPVLTRSPEGGRKSDRGATHVTAERAHVCKMLGINPEDVAAVAAAG